MHRRALAWMAATCVAAAPAFAREELVDGIAAQVGTSIVLVSEVMQAVRPVEQKMREAGMPDSEIYRLRAEGLERMIEERLIEQVARKSELYAEDAEIDEAIETIARENGLTLDQLKASVTLHGMPFSEYRNQIKKEVERKKVVNAMLASKVRVEEADVRQLYDQHYANQPESGSQVHLRQLLVPFGDDSGRDKKAACEQTVLALDRIRRGEPFEQLARQLSAVAPQQGGDIGWLHEDSLASWMVEIVADLEPGETSALVELPSACSLLKLVERREFEPISYERAKPVLQQQLFQERLSEEYRAWMEKLRENTYIERRGYFADAARLGQPSLRRPAGEKQTGEALLP